MSWFSRFIKKIDMATWIAIIFLLSLLVLGFVIHSDYGISWDERAQVDTGRLNYRYIGECQKLCVNGIENSLRPTILKTNS